MTVQVVYRTEQLGFTMHPNDADRMETSTDPVLHCFPGFLCPNYSMVFSTVTKNYNYVIQVLTGLAGGFHLLQNFSVAISVSPHVCFILV